MLGWLASRLEKRELRVPSFAIVLAMLAAGALMWTLRIRHVLLGDGIPISNLLPSDHAIHPREPLAMALQHVFYAALRPVFAARDGASEHVVQDCVAVGSVLAGMLFVPVAWGLGRELVASFVGEGQKPRGPVALGLCFALLAQGYAQVFFGYVENYAYPALVAALYAWTALRFLRGAGPLWMPMMLAALGVALDFTGLVLGPSAVVLVIAGLVDPARRGPVVRNLFAVLVVAAAALAWVALGPLHYPLLTHAKAMLASGHGGASSLLAFAHVRDFLDEHLLVGPFGLFLFVPAALATLVAWPSPAPRASVAFLLVLGSAIALACWVTPDLPLGYARDWDLFVPLAVPLTIAALGLTLAIALTPGARWRMVAAIAIVSLFHTAPWILLNVSEARSLARFETLPLGQGRVENTVGYWYAQHGDRAEARQWLARSLAANPLNSRAVDLLGRIAFDEHRPRQALKAYLVAVALRPDKPDYRAQLAAAVAACGGPEPALALLDTLQSGRADDGGLWFDRALLLRAAGRADEADEAKRRALRIAPELAALRDSL